MKATSISKMSAMGKHRAEHGPSSSIPLVCVIARSRVATVNREKHSRWGDGKDRRRMQFSP